MMWSRLTRQSSFVRQQLWRRRPQSSLSAPDWHDRQLDSVVKIYSIVSSPNYLLPWQNKAQREVAGSGFVLNGNHIVTNAHVVADQNWIQVRKHGSHAKHSASVKFVNHECDLALLHVNDAAFWKDLPTLELGGIPSMQDEVVVAGYPSGGDNLCVTRGIVSRVEPQQYCHGASSLLAVQIDAAINPGNSGGPALMQGKVAGVAFQSHVGAENCGFIIPVPVIEHFLRDAQLDGPASMKGFCSLGVLCQATENKQLRDYLRIPDSHTGVLVNKVRRVSPAFGVIKENDVLLEFDGHRIASDGTINWRNRERISFDYLISMKYVNDSCQVLVLRDGEEILLEMKLFPEEHLVPVHRYDRMSEYLITAGLVFSPLIQPYLHEFGDDWYNRAPRKLTDLAMNALIESPDQQIIVLSQVLIHDINIGYSDLINLRLLKFNDQVVRNMSHLSSLLASAYENRQQFVRIELDDNRVIAINLDLARSTMPEILSRHRVPADRSPNLMERGSFGKIEPATVTSREQVLSTAQVQTNV